MIAARARRRTVIERVSGDLVSLTIKNQWLAFKVRGRLIVKALQDQPRQAVNVAPVNRNPQEAYLTSGLTFSAAESWWQALSAMDPAFL